MENNKASIIFQLRKLNIKNRIVKTSKNMTGLLFNNIVDLGEFIL